MLIPLGPFPGYSRLSFYTWKITRSMNKKNPGLNGTRTQGMFCFLTKQTKRHSASSTPDLSTDCSQHTCTWRPWKEKIPNLVNRLFPRRTNEETFAEETKCFWKHEKLFFLPASKFSFRNKCFLGQETGKHLLPQHYFLVCGGHKSWSAVNSFYILRREWITVKYVRDVWCFFF